MRPQEKQVGYTSEWLMETTEYMADLLKNLRHQLLRYSSYAALEVTFRDAIRPMVNGMLDLWHGERADSGFHPARSECRRLHGTSRDPVWRYASRRDLIWMAHHPPRPNPAAASEASWRIAFLLEDVPRAGGIISIVLLAEDLRRLGHQVLVAVRGPKRLDPELADRLEAVSCSDDARLARNLLAWKPQIIAATFWPTVYLAARCYRESGGTVYPVYYVQDFEPDFYPSDPVWFRDAVADTYWATPWSFCKTPWIGGQIRAAGGRVSLVPPALDLEVFHPSMEPPADPPLVLAMVRPASPRRGWPVLREAWTRVYRRAGPSVRFAVYGCGEDDWRRLNAPFPAEVLGVLDTAGVAAACRRAALFVEASDFQGFGRTVAEAMACGVPCALTDSGGVRLFARHGVNALISPPGDAVALAEHILQLVEDPQTRNRLAASCRASVAWMDRMASARATEVLFRDLLSGRTPQAAYGYPTDVLMEAGIRDTK